MRSAEGGYSERHLPINDSRAYTLTARQRDPEPTNGAEADENGVAAKGSRIQKLRGKLQSVMWSDNVQKPTREELEEGHHHAEHEHDEQAGLDHPADGHQFDGHHAVEGEELRSH
jgi:ubiquinol-cytochrome c reductase cytochrome b subunit